ncbi:PAF acetylhydrolase family protein [Aspergillus foveolatus]|uniref:PAF acetylhydrolase family protein n=1 Tax=Aspergillus foveolatus TaxID=210207 RepID=UPI003CCD2565
MIRAILCSIYFLLISLGQMAIAPLLPSTGPCDVTLHASELVDTSQTNPYDPRGGKRSIMVTTFIPVICGSVPSASYIPNATARYEDASLCIQAQPQQQQMPFSHDGDYPVVFFSPALATSRLMYTLLLQDIASNGSAVVSVDHPYDADIVEYPDGRTVLGILANTSTEIEFVSAMNDEKVIRDIFPLPQGNAHLLFLDRVTILGHSLGGATAAQTILVDNRFGLSIPFLLFGYANHTHTTEPSWATFLSQSRGWKLELQLAYTRLFIYTINFLSPKRLDVGFAHILSGYHGIPRLPDCTIEPAP